MDKWEKVEPPKLSGRELCELIVEVYKPEKDGRPLTWEEVWNWSPTGELSHVYSYGLDAYAIKHNLVPIVDYQRGPTFMDITFWKKKET